MAHTKHSDEADPTFWRCERCGTPNPWAKYLTTCVGCGASRPQTRRSPARDEPIAAAENVTKVALPARPWGRWVALASWIYAAVVLIVLALLRWLAERWWLATLLQYVPRWAFLFPLPILVLLAGRARRRRLWGWHAATAIIIAGPLMGLSLPLGPLLMPPPRGATIRIMTLNKGGGLIDARAVARLIERENLDVLCLQEMRLKRGDAQLLEAVLARGWHLNDSETIATRLPIVEEQEDTDEWFPERQFWPVRLSWVRLRLPDRREFWVASTHMPTMRTGAAFLREGQIESLNRYISWRWQQIGELAISLAAKTRNAPVLVGGDFNMPRDSPMMDLLRQEFRVGFEEAGWGYGYTRPSTLPWVGIDQVLASSKWRFRRCWVGPDVGSDHLPMIAEVVLPAPDVREKPAK